MARRSRLFGPVVRLIPLTVLCVTLMACGRGPVGDDTAHENRLVIGFSPIVSDGGWMGANSASVHEAARAANMEVRTEQSRYSQETQVSALRSFVQQRVDVIVLSPVVETGWDLVLREIRSAGIPVILMDRSIDVSDPSLYVSLVGSDFVEEGRRAARWLIENTQGEPGEIAIFELRGSKGSTPANDRKLGFAEVLAADKRFRIVDSQDGDFFRARARSITTGFLAREGPPLRVIFAHNDGMALGAIEALEAAGLKPGSDVLVIGIEGSRAGLEAIVAGKLNVSVECSPLLGPQLIAVARDAAARKQVPRRVVTNETMFTRENAAEELPRRPF